MPQRSASITGSSVKLLALLAVALALAVVSAFAAASEPARRPDWPPFQMMYEEFGYPSGVSAPPTTDTWVVTWHRRGRWEKQLIGSQGNSQAVGDTYQFDGTRFTVELSLPGADDIAINHTDGVPVMPNAWLVPGRDAALVPKGFRRSAGPESNIVQYQRDVTVPCSAAGPDQHPAACATGTTFTRHETIVYTTTITPLMPVALWDEIDGQVVWRVSVLRVESITE